MLCLYHLLHLSAAVDTSLQAVRLRGNRDHLAGAAVQEVMLESTLVSRPGLPPAQLLLPERVRLAQLPLHRPARFSVQSEVEPGQYGDFTMLQQQPYKVRASCAADDAACTSK